MKKCDCAAKPDLDVCYLDDCNVLPINIHGEVKALKCPACHKIFFPEDKQSMHLDPVMKFCYVCDWPLDLMSYDFLTKEYKSKCEKCEKTFYFIKKDLFI